MEAKRCTAISDRSGEQCKRLAVAGGDVCTHHGAEVRRRTVVRASRCSAHSSQTGQPCKNLAILGASVCRDHGGAIPAVRAAAARVVSVAEMLARNPRRTPQQILSDLLHQADVLNRQAMAEYGQESGFEKLQLLFATQQRAQELAVHVSRLPVAQLTTDEKVALAEQLLDEALAEQQAVNDKKAASLRSLGMSDEDIDKVREGTYRWPSPWTEEGHPRWSA